MRKSIRVRPFLIKSDSETNIWSYKFNNKIYYDVANLNTIDETTYYKLVLCNIEKDVNIGVGDIVTDGCDIGIIRSINDGFYSISKLDGSMLMENKPKSLLGGLYKVEATHEFILPEIINRIIKEYNNGGMNDFYFWDSMKVLYFEDVCNGWFNMSDDSLNIIHPSKETKECDEIDILSEHLKNTDLSISELIERGVLSSIVQAMRAYKFN